jgi:uncharacterized phiE125 gp8 family phage protein
MKTIFPERTEILVKPVNLPVELEFVRQHVRLPSGVTDFDVSLTGYIKAYRSKVEFFTGKTLINTSKKSFWNCFPGFGYTLCIEDDPKLSVSAIEYLDPDGALQTLDSDKYEVYNDGDFNKILPAKNEKFPDTQDEKPDTVMVTYTAGFGAESSDVPFDIQLVIADLAKAEHEGCSDEKLVSKSLMRLTDYKPAMV